MSSHTSLKGVREIGEALLSEQLEANVSDFFRWGLLGIGAFANVTIPNSGVYGGNAHELRRSEDPRYVDGTIYEGFRKDWVWESGVEFRTQPIQISGVFVNGNFVPAASTGVYSHHVDYPNGRIVFDNALSTDDTVTCEYSYRFFQWYSADSPWWRQIQYDSFRVDHPHFMQLGSGAWSILAENRVQLPAVIMDVLPETERAPYELGSAAAIVRQNVLFHVLAENGSDRKKAHDIITYQWHKRIRAFDVNLLVEEEKFPLTAEGSIAPSAIMYPQMVEHVDDGGYFWNQLRVVDMKSVDQGRSLPLYWCSIRATLEVDGI